ncbi:hypothetical protein JST97_03145 [bacterium]|nr:hypothetical protein [bacterium]
MRSESRAALSRLLAAAKRLLELKRIWDRQFEHPVTRPVLSQEQIERYRQELHLSPDQVERLRQRLPIRLSGEQLLHLQERMRVAVPAEQPEPQPQPLALHLPGPSKPVDVQGYYDQVRRAKWRGIPEEMRAGLRVDRWGVVFKKNPEGRGWKELGSDDDFEILPNSSW